MGRSPLLRERVFGFQGGTKSRSRPENGDSKILTLIEMSIDRGANPMKPSSPRNQKYFDLLKNTRIVPRDDDLTLTAVENWSKITPGGGGQKLKILEVSGIDPEPF